MPNFILVTDTFDLNNRMIKTLACVQVAFWNIDDLEVAVQYRYDSGDAFTQSRFYPVNREGFCFPRLSAPEFRIAIQGVAAAGAKLDYINISWQQSDNRGIRGLTNRGTLTEQV